MSCPRCKSADTVFMKTATEIVGVRCNACNWREARAGRSFCVHIEKNQLPPFATFDIQMLEEHKPSAVVNQHRVICHWCAGGLRGELQMAEEKNPEVSEEARKLCKEFGYTPEAFEPVWRATQTLFGMRGIRYGLSLAVAFYAKAHGVTLAEAIEHIQRKHTP